MLNINRIRFHCGQQTSWEASPKSLLTLSLSITLSNSLYILPQPRSPSSSVALLQHHNWNLPLHKQMKRKRRLASLFYIINLVKSFDAFFILLVILFQILAGPNIGSQPTSGLSFGSPTQSNPSGASTSSAFGQTFANPFSSTTSNSFAPKPSTFSSSEFGPTYAHAFISPFNAASSSPFDTSSTTRFLFGSTFTPTFQGRSSPSLFGASSTPAFGSSSSIIGFASTPTPTLAFGASLTFGNTQLTRLFSCVAPLGQTTSIIGQTSSIFEQGTSTFGQTNPFFSLQLCF